MARAKREVLFEYPALPWWESTIYFAILISVLSYAWYLVYLVTIRGDMQDERFENWMRPDRNWWLNEDRYKDVTDKEWIYWRDVVWTWLPFQIIHWSMFNWLHMASKVSIVALNTKDIFLLMVSIAGCIYTFGFLPFAATLLGGSSLFLITHYTRSRALMWTAVLPALYLAAEVSKRLPTNGFCCMVLCMYVATKYISYCIEMLDCNLRPEDQTLMRRYYRLLQYAYFPPYLISVIVNYDDWEKQLRERQIRPRNYPVMLYTVARLIFWYLVVDNMLYVFHMNAVIRHPGIVGHCDLGTLAALGYAIGQYFHLKYVVIFGLPSMFAYLDNLQPYDPPVCIARISLYSKMWRRFDAGLYAFFKRYIFLPICRPTFSLPRKSVAMLLVFGFVSVWHGFEHHNNVWIALNIAEILVEIGSKQLYVVTGFKSWRERHISDTMFRRILAWLQVFPYTMALISIFYFLGGSMAGWTFVERIIIQELLTMGYPAVMLICLGYVYCNCCMDCERWENNKQHKLKHN